MPFSYGCSEENLAHYTCFKTGEAIEIDGRAVESVWEKAPRSNRFVDMVTGEPAFFDTFTSLLWDDEALYLAYWIQEPNVQAGLAERDSLIYTENDVEFFIAGHDCYYELEINALGTIYEALFIWQDALKKGSRFDVPEFELTGHKVDLLGGFQDAFDHPRGARWAFRDWDFPGLQAAVHVDGTLNDSSDVDGGWTVELALPWKGMQWMADGRCLPPREGDIWRVDISRFERLSYNGITAPQSAGWVWNRHGLYDSHIPEYRGRRGGPAGESPGLRRADH